MNNGDVLFVDSGTLWLVAGLVVLVLGAAIGGIRWKMSESAQENAEQLKSLKKEVVRLQDPNGAAKREADLRKRALAEALRREPQLADATDPASTQHLATLVEQVTQELTLREEVEQLQEEQRLETERQEREAARLKGIEEQRVRKQEEQERLRREKEASARAREERLAAMSPMGRWLAKNKWIVAGGAAVVVLVLLAVTIGPTIAARLTRNCEPNISKGRETYAGQNMAGCDLAGRTLQGRNFAGANLSQANLAGANISSANFEGTDLSDANLSQANVTRANLRNSDLSGANATSANFTDADLAGAQLESIVWDGAVCPSGVTAAAGAACP